MASPVVDISYFLHRSVLPEVAAAHHAALVQHYHRSHTEAIKSFGMHGYELEMDTLLEEYRSEDRERGGGGEGESPTNIAGMRL